MKTNQSKLVQDPVAADGSRLHYPESQSGLTSAATVWKGNPAKPTRSSTFSVRCWMFDVLLTLLLFLASAGAGFGQPNIITQPQNQTNVVGTTANFSVQATNSAPLAYQWQKFVSASWADLTGRTNATLVLTNVQTSDAADYRVAVTNVDGATNSDVAHLYVVTPPQVTPTITLQHQAVHVGTSASFTVMASGTASLSYQWRLDGHDLSGQTSNKLSFSDVQPTDEGDYTVVVTNVAGTVTSELARLWVVPPPSAFIRGDFTNVQGARLPYYYLMPTNYNPARSYPLICFFHGGGGDENLFTNGAPVGWPGYANFTITKVFASYRQQAADPTIVLWPTHQAGGNGWGIDEVRLTWELVDTWFSTFNLDTNRLYAGGLSGGGYAVKEFVKQRPSSIAAAMNLDDSQGTSTATAMSIKDVPLWVFSAGFFSNARGAVRLLRLAGGNPIYTEYASAGHEDGIGMGLCTPAAVDWLLAQRRGVAPTNDPLLSINSPTLAPTNATGAMTVNLAGSAVSLGQPVTLVSWTNAANNVKGTGSGTNTWSVTGIPLVANKTNLIIVTATTTSWAPAFGGNTTFNDTLAVIQSPIQATLTLQGTEAILNWTGGGPPYHVQRATDLAAGDWTDYLTNATSPVPLPLTGQAGFYRIVGQ